MLPWNFSSVFNVVLIYYLFWIEFHSAISKFPGREGDLTVGLILVRYGKVRERAHSQGSSRVQEHSIKMIADSCQLALFIWRCFVVRTQCATTSLCTNVSCAWRTLRGPYGPWTRWSSTRGGLNGALRARWHNQSSGTSSRPAIKTFSICTLCVLWFFTSFSNLFLYLF